MTRRWGATMTDLATRRANLVAQVQQTSQLLAGTAIVHPEQVLAAAVIELLLALKEKGDD